MVVADTNIWARALLNDDVAQAQKARRTLAIARSKVGVFVPLLVVAELVWVLRPKWERERVLGALEKLLQMRGVTVESATVMEEAIRATRAGKGGFADHLIAQVGFANGADQVITLDERFARSPNVRLLK